MVDDETGTQVINPHAESYSGYDHLNPVFSPLRMHFLFVLL